MSHFHMNVPCFVKVSIDDDRAYGLVLQREIALFRESRDGIDVEVGTLNFKHAEGRDGTFIWHKTLWLLCFYWKIFLKKKFTIYLPYKKRTLSDTSLFTGEVIQGFVERIREDGKIDVSIRYVSCLLMANFTVLL